MGFYPLYNHCVMLKPTRRQRFRIWLASKLFGLARRVSKGIEPRFLANAQEAFLVADRERNAQLVAGRGLSSVGLKLEARDAERQFEALMEEQKKDRP